MYIERITEPVVGTKSGEGLQAMSICLCLCVCRQYMRVAIPDASHNCTRGAATVNR